MNNVGWPIMADEIKIFTIFTMKLHDRPGDT